MSEPVYIIAEAGVNHNGQLDLALQLIDAAKAAGADAVKFQTFRAEQLVCRNAEKADYQKKATGGDQSQYDMLKSLELSYDDFSTLKTRCDAVNIDFLSSPFDLDSIEFLASLDMPYFKVASGEITNLPFLRKIGQAGVPVILSTGMATLGEIEDAIDVLENAGLKRSDLTVLHCNTEYPTPLADVNLNAMTTISRAFPGISTGYSDHTTGITVPIAATAMGAGVIEKHFTLDSEMDGPDHRASLTPSALKEMVTAIRDVEAALGTGVKQPSASEKKNKPVARKSIVAKRPVKKGELLTEENMTVKRPGTGLSPMLWDVILGTRAVCDLKADDPISISQVEYP